MIISEIEEVKALLHIKKYNNASGTFLLNNRKIDIIQYSLKVV